jgi:hypothetical protein
MILLNELCPFIITSLRSVTLGESYIVFHCWSHTISCTNIKLEGALSGNVNHSGFPVDGTHSKQHSMLEIFLGRAECSHYVTDVDCCWDPPLRWCLQQLGHWLSLELIPLSFMPYSADLTPVFCNVFEPLGVPLCRTDKGLKGLMGLMCVVHNSLQHQPDEVFSDVELMTHLKMCTGKEDIEKLW